MVLQKKTTTTQQTFKHLYTNDFDELLYSFNLQIKYNIYTVRQYTCYTYIRNIEIQIKFNKTIFQ